jgi:succinate dehydrogenase/fumarate reductase flavoprotein subunit
MEQIKNWDQEADVVVVGYGLAGGVAAITAHDAGARVLLLEKMPHPGGISILSGGGVGMAHDAEGAFRYLKRTCNGTTPDEVLWPLAKGMTEVLGWVGEMAKVTGTEPDKSEVRGSGTYPFPGTDSMDSIKLKDFPAYSTFPWAKGMRGGARLFKIIYDNLDQRKIPVMLATPVTRLITNPDGHVVGVSAQRDGEEIKIKARRGVVLTCGGFENNSEMKLQYFELQPVYPVYLGNTGDGILMAQKIGAALWHMWHFHGSYGFKFPEFPFAIRHVWAGPRKDDRKMIWIALDRYGHRFMNEYPPAPQDTGARPLEFYDPDIQDYPPVAMVIVNDERYHYQWSEDNSAEIEKGWIQKGGTLEEIVEKTKIPKDALISTVARWNKNCEQGSDGDFKRRPKTMMPIATPPFYAMEAWPIVSNTQGGLVHDALQRVLDPMGQPIPHLYAAGEISSIYGHLYLEAGNITEAFVGGRIAGQNVSREEPPN